MSKNDRVGAGGDSAKGDARRDECRATGLVAEEVGMTIRFPGLPTAEQEEAILAANRAANATVARLRRLRDAVAAEVGQ